jgi:hypothetical protein
MQWRGEADELLPVATTRADNTERNPHMSGKIQDVINYLNAHHGWAEYTEVKASTSRKAIDEAERCGIVILQVQDDGPVYIQLVKFETHAWFDDPMGPLEM